MVFKNSKSFISLLDKKIPKVPCYISGNILPKNGTLLFGGNSKIGKSFLALNMARSLALGENLYHSDHIKCEECSVQLIEQEIGEDGLQVRGGKIFDNCDRDKVDRNFQYNTKLSDLILNKPLGQKILYDIVEETKPNVLILDPIGKMHTCDENSASEIGALFTFFDRLKKINPEKEMAVVLTHHFKKLNKEFVKSADDNLDPHNFRGSNRWFSDPDTIITVQKVRDHEEVNDYERYKWWEIRCRFNLRQDETPDDMMFSVNKEQFRDYKGDCQVRYEYSIDDDRLVNKKAPIPKMKGKVCGAPVQQKMFRP